MSAQLIEAMATSKFPGDIMVDILTRVPVNSLLRFKSVSRTWRALFNDPIFINAHIRRSNTSAKARDSISLIFHVSRRGITKGLPNEIISVSLDPPYLNQVDANLSPEFLSVGDNFIIVGSINGLTCITMSVDATSIILWNPAIRKQFEIPKPNFALGRDEYASVGFAYDPAMDDYKVIRILDTFYKHNSRVELYSRLTNSWKMIQVQNLPRMLYDRTCTAIANGVPYWCEVGRGARTAAAYVVWFDVASECFRIEHLNFHIQPSPLLMRSGVIRDYSSVIAHCSVHWDVWHWVHIWTWNQRGSNYEGVAWTKTITIGPLTSLVRVVGCWKDGKAIAETIEGTLMLYDPAPRCRILQNLACWDYLKAYDYVESLVSPTQQA